MKDKGKISNLSNEELLDFYKKESRSEYFAELYKRYIPLVYGLCLKYLGNKDDAQDAVMDIYEEVSKKIFQYEIKNFHTWLYSVAKNHCLGKLRKENKNVFLNIDHIIMENEENFTLIDGERSEKEERALSFCLNELNKEQRKSIDLFYFENKSYADIADETGFTLEKVKSYIQNGKRNLKNCILRVLNGN
ncbi:RNA polymerase, sigma-24 subunit, ECF subfamily [uncultured Paludibacter sp.]|uniref:RNA polymerase, sigma-24 subunit, ECF subfamily n=1 Tax=uncultured Paludibacter sp. TaxID=497635 RepID=A0A653AD08_9BACT|nr:RNA polymerase, sigma-24 subunit, ECF subfamily [uncultured Paludibacter sp.]